MGERIHIFRRWLKDLFHIGTRMRTESRKEEPEEYSNPYISCSRQVIEQILRQKGLDYRRFRPIVIDTDTPNRIFGEEDDVDQVLSQIGEGLNFLEICTDRPEHFSEWKEYMEEEYGLIVRVVPKQGEDRLYGNMVLDFERHQPMWMDRFPKETLYLPFQKIPWHPVPAEEKSAESMAKEGDRNIPDHKTEKSAGNMPEKTAENKESLQEEYLDIKVPIGYNMLIVKVKKDL